MLAELKNGMGPEDILNRMDEGFPKLWVIYKALQLRQKHPNWFGKGSAYIPMNVEGPGREYVVGYLRGENVAVIAPRWNLKNSGNFGSTTIELPHGIWKDIFTDEEFEGRNMRAQNLLKRFPVALLVRNGE